MLIIDGSFGEGGGQILRSSLALSLVTGRAFRLENIRSRRKKPGLMNQHLTAVKAAATIGQASTEGAVLGSPALEFTPGKVVPGDYFFSIGTAGSATLVLQTVLPALIAATGGSRVTLEGGTHNAFAPPFDYLDRVFVPLVNRMGPRITLDLHRAGFYPAGGGRFRVDIEPPADWTPLHLASARSKPKLRAKAMVARLPRHIAQRELDVVAAKLPIKKSKLEIEEVVASHGPGNAVMIEIDHGESREMFTGFGKLGVKAERVAELAVTEAKAFLAAGVPVGPHLADQLLLPMALAGGGSFETTEPTPHTTTNINTLQSFLDIAVDVREQAAGLWKVTIGDTR